MDNKRLIQKIFEALIRPKTNTGMHAVAVTNPDATPLASSLAGYVLANYDDASNPVYLGKVDSTGNWIIVEINTTNKTNKLAAGTSEYTTNWTNRAGLTYANYDSVF